MKNQIFKLMIMTFSLSTLLPASLYASDLQLPFTNVLYNSLPEEWKDSSKGFPETFQVEGFNVGPHTVSAGYGLVYTNRREFSPAVGFRLTNTSFQKYRISMVMTDGYSKGEEFWDVLNVRDSANAPIKWNNGHRESNLIPIVFSVRISYTNKNYDLLLDNNDSREIIHQALKETKTPWWSSYKTPTDSGGAPFAATFENLEQISSFLKHLESLIEEKETLEGFPTKNGLKSKKTICRLLL